MKFENVKPEIVYKASLAALHDFERVCEVERNNQLEEFRYQTVTGFFGRNPRTIKLSNEEILERFDIEFDVLETVQREERVTLNLLNLAAETAMDHDWLMSLTDKEFLVIRNYL